MKWNVLAVCGIRLTQANNEGERELSVHGGIEH